MPPKRCRCRELFLNIVATGIVNMQSTFCLSHPETPTSLQRHPGTHEIVDDLWRQLQYCGCGGRLPRRKM